MTGKPIKLLQDFFPFDPSKKDAEFRGQFVLRKLTECVHRERSVMAKRADGNCKNRETKFGSSPFVATANWAETDGERAHMASRLVRIRGRAPRDVHLVSRLVTKR